LYFFEEVTEESHETYQSSIKDNNYKNVPVQDTTQKSTKPDKDLFMHHFDLFHKSVIEYKKGSIGALEIATEVSKLVSILCPKCSEEKKNELWHALVEQFGIIFH
jgi:hypothetical protein